jgi:hypothetical protein
MRIITYSDLHLEFGSGWILPPDANGDVMILASLAVDKDTHRVYTPEQEVDGRPAARMRVYEAVTGQATSLR